MMEEFGKGLVVEPYVTTVIMTGSIIEAGGSIAHREGVLAEIMAGTKLGSVAYVEPQARFNLADVTTTATATDNGYIVSGFKGVVLGGPSADLWSYRHARRESNGTPKALRCFSLTLMRKEFLGEIIQQ